MILQRLADRLADGAEGRGGKARRAAAFLKLHGATLLTAALCVVVSLSVVLGNVISAEAAKTKDYTYTVSPKASTGDVAADWTAFKVTVTVTLDSSGNAKGDYAKVKSAARGDKSLKTSAVFSSAALDKGVALDGQQYPSKANISQALLPKYSDDGQVTCDFIENDTAYDPTAGTTSFLGIDTSGLYKGASDNLSSISTSGVTNSFSKLIGNNTKAYKKVKKSVNDVTEALGLSLLAIVFTIRFAQLGSKIDGAQAMPGFRELAFYMLLFGIMYYLICNAMTIMEGLYNLFNWVTKQLPLGQTTSGNTDLSNLAYENTDDFTKLLTGIILWLMTLLVQVVAYFSIVGRGLQLYIMTIFSPVAMSFFGLDETRQWGVGFFKNFIALCMTGAIILCVIALFPSLVGAAVGNSSVPQVFAVCLIAITALGKSGAWAKEVLGG